MEDPWQRAYDFAVEVARKAGEEIRKAGEREIRVMTKSSTVDLVTKTDERVEKIIIGSLTDEFGEGTHCFIGEESVAKGEPCILTDKPTWIIDPVDGTTNFVHGFPFVAVSIAFAVNKQLEFGVVYSCLEDKMYKARKGKGAFCNDQQIQVSDVKDIHKSIIISEHGTDRSSEKVTKTFSTMQKILCIPVHGNLQSGVGPQVPSPKQMQERVMDEGMKPKKSGPSGRIQSETRPFETGRRRGATPSNGNHQLDRAEASGNVNRGALLHDGYVLLERLADHLTEANGTVRGFSLDD